MNSNLILGDSLEELKKLNDNSVDSIITDPPYGLGEVKDIHALLSSWMSGGNGDEAVGKKGFMGKEWDKSVPPPSLWKECLRVLKPGGHMLVFAGTRTQDLMGISVRLGGWELRDEISYFGNINWTYGSGFPKSLNVSKAIDKEAGAEREIIGIHTRHGGGNAISGSMSGPLGTASALPLTAPATPEAVQWNGWGTALKPAHEIILVFRKPLSEDTVAKNVLKHGTGGLNIDESRITLGDGEENPSIARYESTKQQGNNGWDHVNRGANFDEATADSMNRGRWPANVIFDEEAARVLDEQSGMLKSGNLKPYSQANRDGYSGSMPKVREVMRLGDEGGASRFFYVAKASRKDRGEGNTHPTTKPTKLMEYLCKLVTPPAGIILDPFQGSGTTGVAAKRLGFNYIGIEREASYFEIAKNRIESENKE